PRQAESVRIRNAAAGRRERKILHQVLSHRDSVHHLRHRNGFHDSMGSRLSTALLHSTHETGALPSRKSLVLWTRRNARVHDHSFRRARLRLEKGSAAMGLIAPSDHTVVSYVPETQEGWVAT